MITLHHLPSSIAQTVPCCSCASVPSRTAMDPLGATAAVTGTAPASAAGADAAAAPVADFIDSYGLGPALAELRSAKLRSTFAHYLTDIPVADVPVRPRCPAGSLMELALAPANEDERELVPFDERSLRSALVLTEGGPPVPMPEWLSIEQAWDEDDDRRRRRKEKRRKRRKRRRREEGEGGGDDEGEGDEDGEGGSGKKSRKKKRREGSSSIASGTPA